jgi:acyl-CoA thioester hydrolase
MKTPFRSVQRVYFDDLDALNILHNVRFLLFMERARGELFQALGFLWEDDVAINPDKFHVVAEHQIRYLKPVRGEGDLSVELTPTHLGRSSLVIAAQVRAKHGDELYAEATTRLVRLDPATQAPCPWSARMRERMGPLVAPPAQAATPAKKPRAKTPPRRSAR